MPLHQTHEMLNSRWPADGNGTDHWILYYTWTGWTTLQPLTSFNAQWKSDVVSLYRTCWAISTVVLKALVEMPVKWRWQPPLSRQVLKLNTGESEPWHNRYWLMFQGKSENLLNLGLFFMKAHLYHHLPHKPYGQRLPHHQTDIYLSNSIIEKK